MENISKSILYWIIIECWIIWSVLSQIENLRRNHGEQECMTELVSRKLMSDHQFTASSHYRNEKIFQPNMARLLDIHSQSSPGEGTAWCPASEVHKDLTEWIEVDFGRMTLLRALYTMGRGDGNFDRFSPEMVLKYQRTESTTWHTYRDTQNKSIISINTDSRTKLRTRLQTIVVKKIRIYPLNTLGGPKAVCLKIAFLGCFFDDEVVSYTAPQGDRGLANDHLIDLRDITYDGSRSHLLRDGLGVLMNNVLMKGSGYMPEYTKPGTDTSLIGWRCSEDRVQTPVSVSFHYDQERIFSQISIYYVTDDTYNMKLSAPIVLSIGYDNITHRHIYNQTYRDITSLSAVTIPITQVKGTLCTISISCESNNWIVLSEVHIISTKSSTNKEKIDSNNDFQLPKRNGIVKYEVLNPKPGNHGNGGTVRKQSVTLFLAIGLAVLLVVVLLCSVAFLVYKMRRLHRNRVNKKLAFATKFRKESYCATSSRTVFTMQSKHPSVLSMSRPAVYYSEAKAVPKASSQPSEGVYASWPNTDEDDNVTSKEEEEEEFLLIRDTPEARTMSKDCVIYQPGVPFAKPSIGSVAGQVPLAMVHPMMAPPYDLSMSPSIAQFRNLQNLISYQHFANYRGICGDVDLRYQALPVRLDQHGLDSNIRIVSATGLVSVQPWVNGQFGSIDIVTVSLGGNETGKYFMKKLHKDSPTAIRSKFILDLKTFRMLNKATIATLAAIVIDDDLLQCDLGTVIRSGQFSLLVEHNGGLCLKSFLRNAHYAPDPQTCRSNTQTLQMPGPMSVSSTLLILCQISNGLKHLEGLDLAHRDVGCRNCMIDSMKRIKLYPGGFVTNQNSEDYCCVELQKQQFYVPLRWLAPESLYQGTFTSKSDVWSFGVTMWEVFTACGITPYPSVTNEALLELMADCDNSPRLPWPQNCPREVYDVINQCLNWEESKRPTFVDIDVLLHIKTTGVTSHGQIVLPAPPPVNGEYVESH